MPSQQSTNGNLTHYFRDMSLGVFTLIGKTRFVITPHSRQWYLNNDWNRWLINKEVLESLDASLDFAEFDRYKRYGEYDIRREPDGKVDMIFMLYRNVEGMVMEFYGGEASLGIPRTTLGYNEPIDFFVDNSQRKIGGGHPVLQNPADSVSWPGSGTTSVIARTGDGWFGIIPYRVQIHEFAHHWMTDGLNFGHNGDGFWAMLNEFGYRHNSQYQSPPNSFERELMGWIAPDSIYQTTYNVTLTDYLTTGDAIKLKVPGSNANELFRIEYHLKSSQFDNPEMGDANAKGLYILHQTGTTNPYSQLRLLPADGRWTWESDTLMHPTYYPTGLAVYERSGVDRVNGYDDSRRVPLNWVGSPPTPSVPNPFLIHPYRDRTKSTYPIIEQDPRVFRGDGKDAFGVSKNDLFTPWSNPNSQNDAKQKTGVAIEVVSENTQTGVIVLNIYYDSTAALALSPSKPQDVQAYINSSNVSVIMWTANIESDVTTGGGYDVYRAVYWSGATLSYSKINSSLVASATYTDTLQVPTGAPNGADIWYRYYIKAKDGQNKYSLASEDFWLYAGKAVSGTVSSTTWNGQYIVTGNVTVNSGNTLTIQSNSILRFAPNTSLTVNGVLNATSATFLPIKGISAGSWGSIILDGSGASGSTINYATVKYGTEIKANNVPNFTVNNSTIQNMVNGVNAIGSNGWVMNSTVATPRDHGIIANGSTIACYHNIITKTDHSGAGILYIAGGSDFVWHNDISGFAWGVGSIYGSSPEFGNSSNSGVNNRIQDCGSGIEVYQYSSIFMGDEDEETVFYGYSSFLNSNTKHVRVYDYSDVFANYNYWGQYPPNSAKFEVYSGSSLSRARPLTEDPWGGESIVAENDPLDEISTRTLLIKSSGQTVHPFKEAMRLRKLNKFAEAFEYFKQSIENNENVNSALLYIQSLHNDSLGSSIEEYLSEFPINKSPLGLYLYGKILAKKQKINEALAALNRVPSTSSFIKASKLSQFYIYLNKLNDPAKAEEILNELVQLGNENDFEVALAQHDFITTVNAKKSDDEYENKKIINGINSNLETFSLSQNYPNPFNPTTTIGYTIPERSFVRLKVYDAIGREVAVLVDQLKDAGSYNAKFNSSNLPSGLYFYYITAKNITIVKKMLLIK